MAQTMRESITTYPSSSNPRLSYEVLYLEDDANHRWVSCDCPSFIRGKEQTGKASWERNCKHTRRAEGAFTDRLWVLSGRKGLDNATNAKLIKTTPKPKTITPTRPVDAKRTRAEAEAYAKKYAIGYRDIAGQAEQAGFPGEVLDRLRVEIISLFIDGANATDVDIVVDSQKLTLSVRDRRTNMVTAEWRLEGEGKVGKSEQKYNRLSGAIRLLLSASGLRETTETKQAIVAMFEQGAELDAISFNVRLDTVVIDGGKFGRITIPKAPSMVRYTSKPDAQKLLAEAQAEVARLKAVGWGQEDFAKALIEELQPKTRFDNLEL